MTRKQLLEKIEHPEKLSFDEILEVSKAISEAMLKFQKRFEIKPTKTVNRRNKK